MSEYTKDYNNLRAEFDDLRKDNVELQADVTELKAIRNKQAECIVMQEKQLQAELDKHRWIPVSERLPELTDEDLRLKFWVLTEDGPDVQEWRNYTRLEGSFDESCGKPTHWMPIPEKKT